MGNTTPADALQGVCILGGCNNTSRCAPGWLRMRLQLVLRAQVRHSCAQIRRRFADTAHGRWRWQSVSLSWSMLRGAEILARGPGRVLRGKPGCASAPVLRCVTNGHPLLPFFNAENSARAAMASSCRGLCSAVVAAYGAHRRYVRTAVLRAFPPVARQSRRVSFDRDGCCMTQTAFFCRSAPAP